MPRKAKSLREKIKEAKLKLYDLEQEYKTQLYFETMPELDAMYRYCYSTSNQSIPNSLHSVDSWLRAIIKHMATRKPGHGGAKTKALVITIPDFQSEAATDNWIAYVTAKLRKRAAIRKRTTTATENQATSK